MSTSEKYQDFVRSLGDREYFGQKLGLDRIRGILDRLGNPQEKFPAIHIAGTNGKGSTSAMLASILRESGLRVGLFTSPHLEDFCERIRINEELITPAEVLEYEKLIYESSIKKDQPTFFELTTAMGLLHFAWNGVDMVILETGLGGRLDATNAITPIVSVITTIGLDHMQHLGSTIEAIAREKAGIIKRGVPVVIGHMPPEAEAVIASVAANMKAPLHKANREKIPQSWHLGLEGTHQRDNAAVAIEVMDVLKMTAPDPMRKGLETMRWPGRLETVSEKPWIVLDGAHNPQAMKATREYLETKLEGRPLTVLFGAMADKDIDGMLKEIGVIAHKIVLTAPAMKRAAVPGEIASLAQKYCTKVESIPDVRESIASVKARLESKDCLLVTGSFFMVGEARKILCKSLEGNQ